MLVFRLRSKVTAIYVRAIGLVINQSVQTSNIAQKKTEHTYRLRHARSQHIEFPIHSNKPITWAKGKVYALDVLFFSLKK